MCDLTVSTAIAQLREMGLCKVYNVKALEVYNVKTLEVYNVKTLEVYNVKTLEVYNVKLTRGDVRVNPI